MVVVITGASAGIGKALATALHSRGAKLVLAARRLDVLEQLNAALGGAHLTLRCDVSQSSDCENLIRRTLDHFGRIDTLVCNAGYGLLRSVSEMTPQELDQILGTNVFGTTECIRFAVPHLVKQDLRDGHRGQIMIVSSAAARRGLPYFGAYAATKAAQLSLAQALRVELKPSDIAVTTVHPMQTETDFFTVSEQVSARRLPPPGALAKRQSVEAVASSMVRAMEKPVLELWPKRGSKWLLHFAMMFPRLADHFMTRERRVIEASLRRRRPDAES
jgi:short-subunit dehydrogenase